MDSLTVFHKLVKNLNLLNLELRTLNLELGTWKLKTRNSKLFIIPNDYAVLFIGPHQQH